MLECLAGIVLGFVAVNPVQAVGGCSTPSFAQAVGSPIPVGASPHSVAVGDFNREGPSPAQMR